MTMEVVVRNLYYFSMCLYALAALMLILKRGDGIAGSVRIILITGFVFHTISVVSYIALCGYIPMHARTQNCLPRTWGMAMIMIFVLPKLKERLLLGNIILGILILCMVGLPLPLAKEMGVREGFLAPAPFFWFHLYDVAVVIFTYCFSLSFTLLLRRKNSSGLDQCRLQTKIPSTALWGFVFFTFAQIAGSIWAIKDFGDYWHWRPMHLISVAVWMFYAGMIHVRWIPGMSHRTAALMGVTGFSGIMWWTVYHDYGKQIILFAKGVFI